MLGRRGMLDGDYMVTETSLAETFRRERGTRMKFMEYHV